MLRPFIVIGILSTATGAFAEPSVLTGNELKQAVSGATVEIDTPLGATVPMRFGNDGLVAAEAGVLAPVLGSAKDRGRWWVDDEKLCTKWFRWFDAGVRCLTIKKEGNRIFWRKLDDGETGTGTLIAEAKPKIKPTSDGPVVVTKVDPAPEKVSTPERPPVETTTSAPERRATRLAGPEREPDAENADTVVVPPSPPAPAETAVALTDAKPDQEEAPEAAPLIRFGGAGLLDASSFSAIGTARAEDKPANTEKVTTPEPRQPPLAKLPNKAETRTYIVADGAKGKDAGAQRQASLETRSAVRRSPQRRFFSWEENGASATSSSRSVALYRVTRVAGYDVLNVRRGPSELHVQIAAIPPTGRQVEITGACHETWCPIRYKGIMGWVNSYYLAEEGLREEQSAARR